MPEWQIKPCWFLLKEACESAESTDHPRVVPSPILSRLKILNLQTQGKTSTENLEMDNNPFSIFGFGTLFEHLYWLKMCVSEQSIVMYWRKVDDADHLVVNDSEIVRDEIVFLACNSCERTDLELVKRRCHIRISAHIRHCTQPVQGFAPSDACLVHKMQKVCARVQC